MATTATPEAGLKSHSLVVLQLGGVALSCWPVGWVNQGHMAWLLLVLIGTVCGLTTLAYNKIGNFRVYPEPKQDAKLITNGPYRFVRHPMYSSLILMMLGISGYNGYWPNLLGVVCVVIAVTAKAAMEEHYMVLKFSEYEGYAAKTPRFIPRPI